MPKTTEDISEKLAFSRSLASITGDLENAWTSPEINEFKERLYAEFSSGASSSSLDDLVALVQKKNLTIRDKLVFLEATARQLGDDWSDDKSSFLDVTAAMGRLQLILRRVCQSDNQIAASKPTGSVLLCVPPGEEHIFGQSLLEELLRERGWDTQMVVAASQRELAGILEDGNYDVICFSWATGFLAPMVENTIKTVKSARKSKSPVIIAGGYSAEDRSGWLVTLGVDHICDSAHAALALVEKELIGQTAEER